MSEQEALIGRVVDDRYRILEPLGEGGMGVVFRAEHLKLERPVALKVLHEEFVADSDLRQRFDREARALAALAHPNIVTITDYGVMGQTPYLVMELLQGETLHQRLSEQGALPPERAVSIARQMLRALAHAHRHGLVHRDLKPGNIFLTPLPDDSDHVKILDFGLVRFMDGETRGQKNLTRAGSMLGTPSYMAPEQVSGDPSDARTDVYAAAVVIFEMLAGRRPFVGEPTEILRHHLLTPPPTLSDLHRGLEGAEDMSRLLGRALEKQKERRFADGGEMLAALEAVRVPRAASPAPSAPGELATMPTMHASDSSGGVSQAAPLSASFSAAPADEPGAPADEPGAPASPRPPRSSPSGALGLSPETSRGVKRTAAAVGGGLAIAGAIVGLLLVAASSGDEGASGADGAAPGAAGEASSGRAAGPAPAGGARSTGSGSAGAGARRGSAPAEVRPPPRDPWAEGVPRQLSRAKRLTDAGRKLHPSADRGLVRYAQRHDDDARPHLLLARAFLTRGWRSDAVERYELAVRKDASVRGDPRMLKDLVSLAALDDRASAPAARAVRSIYGAEAIAEIDRQLEEAGSRSAKGRLSRLRESVEKRR